MEKQPTQEDVRHKQIIEALYKIASAISELTAEVSILRHAVNAATGKKLA